MMLQRCSCCTPHGGGACNPEFGQTQTMVTELTREGDCAPWLPVCNLSFVSNQVPTLCDAHEHTLSFLSVTSMSPYRRSVAN